MTGPDAPDRPSGARGLPRRNVAAPGESAARVRRLVATVFGTERPRRRRLSALFPFVLFAGVASCGGRFVYDHYLDPHNMERLAVGDCVRVDTLRPESAPAEREERAPLLPMFLIQTNGGLSDFTEVDCSNPDALLVVVNQGKQGCSTTDGLWAVNSIEYQTRKGGRRPHTNGTCLAPRFQVGRCYQASPERGPWRAVDCADPKATFGVDGSADGGKGMPDCGAGHGELFVSPSRGGETSYCLSAPKRPGPR